MALGKKWGDAYVKVSADTSSIPHDLDKGLKDAASEAESVLRDLGSEGGKSYAKAMGDEVGRHGGDLIDAVERDTAKRKVTVKSKVEYDHDELGRFARKAGDDLVSELADGVSDSGLWSKVSAAFSDSVGAVFNVRGSSPLALVLGPALATIPGLILGAVQAVGGLLGTLSLVPAAIGTIAASVLGLNLVFQNMGDAIGLAFSGADPDKLAEALDKLNPSARRFVNQFAPLGDLFRELQKSAQNAFFKEFGNTLASTIKALAPALKSGIPVLAASLGRFFADLGKFFASPAFVDFVKAVLPATARIIDQMGPPFLRLLSVLTTMAEVSLGPLERFVGMIGSAFGQVSESLAGSLGNGSFEDFLNNSLDTLSELWDLLKSVGGFIMALIDSTDQAGGDNFLTFLAEAIDSLTAIISTPTGIEAMKAFFDIAKGGILVLIGLTVTIGAVIAALRSIISQLTEWQEGTWKFLFETIPGWISAAGDKITEWLSGISDWWSDMWSNFPVAASTAVDAVLNSAKKIATYFKDLPQKILDAVGNFGNLLKNAGKDLIRGLIDGINAMIPSLSGVLKWVTDKLPDWKGPMERDRAILMDSGKATMAGYISGIERGAESLRGALGDVTTSLPSMMGSSAASTQSVVFGANAIQLVFQGSTPTPEQARAAGQAAGSGLVSALTGRNIQLAVRTL